MRSRIPWFAATATVGVVALGTPMTAEDWPHWRGPALAGVSGETRLPERWSQTENVSWRAKLGRCLFNAEPQRSSGTVQIA